MNIWLEKNTCSTDKIDKLMLIENGKITPIDINFKCTNPKILPLHKNKKTKWKTLGRLKKIFLTTNHYQKAIVIPCRKCEACLKKRAYEWACRISKEAFYQSYENKRENIFLTLTYDENNKIPFLFEFNGAYKPIVKQHMDKFIKKIKNDTRITINGKRTTDKNINYFWVSELGTHTKRRHQHLIITGLPKSYLSKKLNVGMSKEGLPLFTTENLIKNWKMGIINFGEVNVKSAMYVSQYVFEKNSYENVYKCSSQKIGYNWYFNWKKSDTPNSHVNHEPNQMIERLIKKSMKNDKKYLDYLLWKEKQIIEQAGNYKPITIENYQKPNYFQEQKEHYTLISTIGNRVFHNRTTQEANQRMRAMFNIGKRDFDSSGLYDNNLAIMRLKQIRGKRF